MGVRYSMVSRCQQLLAGDWMYMCRPLCTATGFISLDMYAMYQFYEQNKIDSKISETMQGKRDYLLKGTVRRDLSGVKSGINQ